MNAIAHLSRTDKIKLRIDLIKQVYADTDKTARGIAEAVSRVLHETVTRNAIIGTYHRFRDQLADYPLPMSSLEKSKLNPTPKEVVKQQRRFRLKANRTALEKVFSVDVSAPPFLPEPTEAIDIPSDPNIKGKLLMDLNNKDCKFPVEGKGFVALFCGDAATHGSYCAFHHAKAYRRVQE